MPVPREKLEAKMNLALVVALGAILIAAPADAGKKKKGKKNKQAQQTQVVAADDATVAGLAEPPAAVVEAHKYLLAYETDKAREALGDRPDETDAWVATARCRILGLENDLEAAAAECRRAADLDPSNPAPAFFLGDSLLYAEKQGAAGDAHAQAETRARALLEARPEDPRALYYLGVAQQRQRRFAEAADTLEAVRDARPDNAEVHFELGVTRFYQEKWQQAFDDLSAALQRDSGIALAYYYRGLAAAKLDRKDVLFNDLDRFVKMAPKAPEAATAKQILSSFG